MMKTPCRLDDDNWVSKGRKAFITGAVGAKIWNYHGQVRRWSLHVPRRLPNPAIRVDRVLDTIDNSMPGGHAVVIIDNPRVPSDQMLG